MSDQVVTAVLGMGEESSSSSSLVWQAMVDYVKHKDDEGRGITTFPPLTEVFLLFHHDPAMRIVSLADTAGGDLQRIGVVRRTVEVEVTFTHPQMLYELSYIPAGVAAREWFGRNSGLKVEGRKVSAESTPCRGILTVAFDAVQYLYTPLGPLVFVAGEQFPVDVVVATEG